MPNTAASTRAGVIPAKTYPGQTKDNPIAVVQNILVANAKMPDQVAYDIVKTFIEQQKELIAVHARRRASIWQISSARTRPSPGIRARSATSSSAA